MIFANLFAKNLTFYLFFVYDALRSFFLVRLAKPTTNSHNFETTEQDRNIETVAETSLKLHLSAKCDEGETFKKHQTTYFLMPRKRRT